MPTDKEIAAKQALLRSYKSNLSRIELQIASAGGAEKAPIGLLNDQEKTQEKIAELEEQLRAWAAASEGEPPESAPASTLPAEGEPPESAPASPVANTEGIPVRVWQLALLVCVSCVVGVIVTWLVLLQLRSNEPQASFQRINIDTIIRTISAAPNEEAAVNDINSSFFGGKWWVQTETKDTIEAHPDFDGSYDPKSCIGIAWGVVWEGVTSNEVAIAFRGPQRLRFVEGSGGYYVTICTDQGVELTLRDAARIQAAILSKQYQGTWGFWPTE